jgi:hypothetical protein
LFCPLLHWNCVVASASPVINISVTPVSVNFGNINVGQFSDQTITIANQATSNATLTGSVGALSALFSVQSGGGAFSLTPGQSVTVTVRFSPTGAGAASANLSITHNATNQTTPANISLSGAGVTTPLPDLIVSSISGPNLSKPGGRIAIANTITNQGTQAAGNLVVNFYLSTDQQITTNDIFLGKRSVRGLAAGASSGLVSTNVTIPKSATTYEVQLATDSAFTNVVDSATGLTTPEWAVSPPLSSGTSYFWRSRGVNLCGPGPFSATSSFKTAP